MATQGFGRFHFSRRVGRRCFLGLTAVSIFGLSACGDASSERQFAGDPRTNEPDEPQSTQVVAQFDQGSPTAVPTAMPVSELLTARGAATVAIQPLRHDVVAIEIPSGSESTVWSNRERAVWAAESDPTSAMVAVLTSTADAAEDWAVEFISIVDAVATPAAVGDQRGGSDQHPDAVAGGRGGISWLPDSSSVAVSMPTGGLLQVFPDGSEVRLAKAAVAKRPAALAVSSNGNAIAFIDQPSGSDGSGVYAGSMRARPIDPLVVLAPDRSGNRYAREVEWIGSSSRLATIIEREELGNPQGDLFFLDTRSKSPELAWTSPAGRDIASVASFAISGDGLVTAFLTNPSRSDGRKPSSLWLMQTDGPAIERFDLPASLLDSRIVFSAAGVVVTGVRGKTEDKDGLVGGYLLEPSGAVTTLYEQAPEATPVASPIASPPGSPIASPMPISAAASPSPRDANGS